MSNVNGQPTGKDGNGFLSRVGTDGTLIELEWVKGLNAPKGLEILNDRLFVADIDRLVEVSVSEGKVTHEFPAKGATFLNDVTIDKDGNVYVSDMLGNKLYRLHGDTFEVWLESEALESPNGLFAEDGRLIIACWGKMTEGWNTKVPGHLKTISLVDKTVRSLGRGTPVGNLDGIEPDGSGNYFVSDYTAGKVFHVKPSGEAVPLLAVGPGSADIEFIPEKKLLLVPMMNDGALAAYTLEGTK